MNRQKIAILTDSGTDVPREYARTHDIFIVPLTVTIHGQTFLDDEHLDVQTIFDALHEGTPTTSLPPGETIESALQKIREAGYAHLFIITISSGLSGTYNLMRLLAREIEHLECRLLDTRNIGIAAGMTVLRCRELIEQGLEADQIEHILRKSIQETKVFFYVPTLEYLAKGGRIGKVAATLGTALGIRPIISCDADGCYFPIKKPRGQVKAIAACVQLAVEYAQGRLYNLAIAHGGAAETAHKIKTQLSECIANASHYLEGVISPALCVHTGPGLVGVAVQRLEENLI